MSLAVALCTRSGPGQLRERLAAAEADPLVAQVVVSVDGVDACTEAVAFAAEERSHRVAFTRGPGLGRPSNRNAALAAVVTDHVLFLEDGGWPPPGFLRAALPLAGAGRVVTCRSRGPTALASTIFPTDSLRRHPFDESHRDGGDEASIAMVADAAGLETVVVDIAGTAGVVEMADVSDVVGMADAAGARDGGIDGRPPSVSTSLVVPTYHRPDALKECLEGIARLRMQPDEVIVVRQAADEQSAAVLAGAPPGIHEVVVEGRGQVLQMIAGAAAATGDVVAFLDDDAVPRRDWLAWLAGPYADPGVAGVGGRDVVHGRRGEIEDGAALRVGRVSSWGRVTGRHHVGVGWPRPVDVLKGANCSFRRHLLELPVGLRGAGVAMANDLAASLRLVEAGSRLIFEPRALVDHYPGSRFDGDTRGAPSRQAVLNHSYNETYAVASVRPRTRTRRLAYVLAVGDHTSPGVARTALAHLRREATVTGRLLDTARVTVQAARDARARPLRFVAPGREAVSS